MNTNRFALFVGAILVATLLGIGILLTHLYSKQRDVAAQFAMREKLITALKHETDQRAETNRELEAKLQRVTEVLLESTRQLGEARTELTRLENVHATAAAADVAKISAQPPVITGSRDENNLRILFPELFSKSGASIGKQMEFSSRLGRNLVFKDAAGKRTRLDVDTIHPDQLVAIGVEDRKSTRLNSSHSQQSRMPSSA